MILIDKVGHLVSDSSLQELHEFAGRLYLKREWFQDKRIPHYDLTTPNARRRAQSLGATEVSSRDIVTRAVRV